MLGSARREHTVGSRSGITRRAFVDDAYPSYLDVPGATASARRVLIVTKLAKPVSVSASSSLAIQSLAAHAAYFDVTRITSAATNLPIGLGANTFGRRAPYANTGPICVFGAALAYAPSLAVLARAHLALAAVRVLVSRRLDAVAVLIGAR